MVKIFICPAPNQVGRSSEEFGVVISPSLGGDRFHPMAQLLACADNAPQRAWIRVSNLNGFRMKPLTCGALASSTLAWLYALVKITPICGPSFAASAITSAL